MHRVLHTFYDAQRYQRKSSTKIAGTVSVRSRGCGYCRPLSVRSVFAAGKEQLRQFFEIARAAPPPEVIETEHKFELLVGSSKLTGRVDRMDRTGPGTVAIVDYKTGKPQSQEDADESLQLSLYALAAKETLGKHADRLVLYNLENNTSVSTTRTTRTRRSQVARAKSGGRNRTGKFHANPSITARSVPIAICVRRRRSRSQPRKEARSLTAQCRKNFGDAHRVPFVVACCSCLVLFAAFFFAFFLLPWIYSPFPFFMEFLQRSIVATS